MYNILNDITNQEAGCLEGEGVTMKEIVATARYNHASVEKRLSMTEERRTLMAEVKHKIALNHGVTAEQIDECIKAQNDAFFSPIGVSDIVDLISRL